MLIINDNEVKIYLDPTEVIFITVNEPHTSEGKTPRSTRRVSVHLRNGHSFDVGSQHVDQALADLQTEVKWFKGHASAAAPE